MTRSEVETLPLDRERDPAEVKGRASLIIRSSAGVGAVAIDEGAPITLGRAEPSEVVVPDPSLSRTHARFVLDGGEVWVEDLDSKNGTEIGGKRISRERVGPGEEVSLGSVLVSLHLAQQAPERARGLVSYDAFLARLDEEVVRARCFRRPLSVLSIDGAAQEVASRARAWLGLVDRAAWHSEGRLHVLVPEREGASVAALAAELRAIAPGARVGFATLGVDGASADELLDVADSGRGGAIERDASGTHPLVARSPAMVALLDQCRRLARVDLPVLVVGPTGAGKEEIARLLHDWGPRRPRRMVAVSCGAIPPGLVESVLFGHEKGAFTGADKQRAGLFEEAQGGTLFLDEVGELGALAQAALLRALETKRVTRVGGTSEVAVDVRVVSATHRDLEEMCAAGTFREDLLFRLSGTVLRVPPLSERPQEIVPLVQLFLEAAARAHPGAPREVDPDALSLLCRYPWPGNVRELKHAVERAAAIASEPVIRVHDLPERVLGEAAPRRAPAAVEERAAGEDLRVRVQRFEADLILAELEACGWSITGAAARLGLPVRTLSHKILVHGLRARRGR